MIKAISWILTRKCNLKCDYCGISRNKKNSPYPNLEYFFKNEMSTEFVLKGLEWFKYHNPNCFHLFYGGEPLLRNDLPTIINYCNKNNIFYTIITNNCDQIKDRMKELFSKVDYVAGFTISIDPIIHQYDGTSHRFNKSVQGLTNLLTYMNTYRKMIFDPVAEITVDNNNIDHLIPLIKNLTSRGINSDITVIDISKSEFYDFSNVSDTSYCLHKNNEIIEIFNKIISSNEFDVHMKEILLPKILEILPSELDCQVDKNIHNLTIDSDGSVRLCLRIRGIETPTKKLLDYIDSNGTIKEDLINNIRLDKSKYCQKCNWTCPLMTLEEDNNEMNHIERRNL